MISDEDLFPNPEDEARAMRMEAFYLGMTDVDFAREMLAAEREDHRKLVKVLRSRIFNFKQRAVEAERERGEVQVALASMQRAYDILLRNLARG